MSSMDDTIRSLMRFVARGFYGKPYVLIVDAILVHSVLSEDDLIHLLGIQRKELRSLCNKLVEDRLITNHVQKEENAQQRLTTRTYYFQQKTEAIDAIKWKVHSIVKLIKDEMSHDGNPQGYICPRCKSRYSQLDAISMLSDDKLSFICDVCGGTLIGDDSGIQAKLRQEKLEKLMLQLDPIITYLKKIDDSYIEDNTFESSLTKSIPAQSTTTASYSVANNNSRIKSGMSSSLQSAAQRSQATLHVSITANDENLIREKRDRELKQERIKQNALPSWHSESTVGKSVLGRLDDDEREETPGTDTPVNEVNSTIKTEVKQENYTTNVHPATADDSEENTLADQQNEDILAAYYAELAQRKAKEEEEEEEDDEDDEDDGFDDEFEDVEIDENTMANETPSASSLPPQSATNELIVEEFDGESDED